MIDVFKYEIDDGLQEAIASTNFVIANCILNPISREVDDKSINGFKSIAIASDLTLPDLFPLDGILVSTGLNNNDDYFEKDRTFAAKDSPIHKPFNYEHKSGDIIGHMTSSKVLDLSGIEIASDSETPDNFDIAFSGFLYRHFPKDDTKQKRQTKIIEEITNASEEDELKWSVSMECRFRGFDYFIYPENETPSSSSAKIVERNNDTAYLTKHLRIYKGSGAYKGNKVTRALKNITFSAIGLTQTPANERSVILSSAGRSSGKIHYISNMSGYEIDSGMCNAKETMNETEFKAKLAEKDAKVTELETKLSEATKANWESKLQEANVSIASLKTEIATDKSALQAAKSEAEVAKAALVTLESEKKTLQDELNKFKDEVTKAEASRKELDRVAKVKDAYALASDDEAKKISDPLTALSDDAFAAHINAISAIKKPSNSTESSQASQAATASNALATATSVKEPDLTIVTPNDNVEDQALAAELENFFGLTSASEDDVDSAKSKKNTKKTKK